LGAVKRVERFARLEGANDFSRARSGAA